MLYVRVERGGGGGGGGWGGGGTQQSHTRMAIYNNVGLWL